MPATPDWPRKRKYFPHLAFAPRGPQGKASPVQVQASGFKAWVWLQEPPSTNQSEPAALSLPCCQVKQNTGNTNRIITINWLLEPDTGEPTPWHCHPLSGPDMMRCSEGWGRCGPWAFLPSKKPSGLSGLIATHMDCSRSCLPRQGGRRVSLSSKPWITGKCPSHPLRLTNAACQRGNSSNAFKSQRLRRLGGIRAGRDSLQGQAWGGEKKRRWG